VELPRDSRPPYSGAGLTRLSRPDFFRSEASDTAKRRLRDLLEEKGQSGYTWSRRVAMIRSAFEGWTVESALPWNTITRGAFNRPYGNRIVITTYDHAEIVGSLR
jgi:hypothetical protein